MIYAASASTQLLHLRSLCFFRLTCNIFTFKLPSPLPPVYTAPFSSPGGASSPAPPFQAVDPSLCMREVCDGCNISLNPDSKNTGVPRRCSGNTFSSRSEDSRGIKFKSTFCPELSHLWFSLFLSKKTHVALIPDYMAMPGQPLLNLWMIMISRPVLSFAKLPVSYLTEEI